MAAYWIDDGGDNSDGSTLAKAYTSFASAIAGVPAMFTTGGNVVYLGHDHNDPNKAAHWTLTGPSSGAPVKIISVDSGQSTPTYRKGEGNQISSLGGAFSTSLDGHFYFFGVSFVSGSNISFLPRYQGIIRCEYCRIKPGNGGAIRHFIATIGGWLTIKNSELDFSSDTSNSTAQNFEFRGPVILSGCTYIKAASYNRTGVLFLNSASYSDVTISGCDFSAISSSNDICSSGANLDNIKINNCTFPSSYSISSGAIAAAYGRVEVTNSGSSDNDAFCWSTDSYGTVISTSSIYRSGGAVINGVNESLLVTTTAQCSSTDVLSLPWMYGYLSSSGSKTFTVYITNDSADFTNSEVWIELEYKQTSGSPIFTTAGNQVVNPIASASAQTDDTTSTWSGTGPSFTYKQALSVTATVGQSGLYRARVCVAAASIAGSRYFYVDPTVVVS